ncbi:MAG: hypothetical protein JO041_02795 [Acidobacteria bacterium]|nr:hypothetical protein [Acidobacteriota bacterium]
MATNPVDPNLNRRPPFEDPDLAPPGGEKRPFPWGILGAIITAAVLGLIIWYFVAGAPGH